MPVPDSGKKASGNEPRLWIYWLFSLPEDGFPVAFRRHSKQRLETAGEMVLIHITELFRDFRDAALPSVSSSAALFSFRRSI